MPTFLLASPARFEEIRGAFSSRLVRRAVFRQSKGK